MVTRRDKRMAPSAGRHHSSASASHPQPRHHPQQQQQQWNPRDVWSPAPTRETFKDVLMFEERLKQNAERLQKQRRKYQAFLVSLALLIVHFAYKVFVLPSVYSLVHYLNLALLLVSLVTLVLFFATGMYSEKIAYAYRFVPQANRALRPLNIYLNTRKRSWISYLSLFRIAAAPPVAQPPSLTSTPKSSPSSPATSPLSMSPVTSDNESSTPASNKTSSRAGGSRRTSVSSTLSAATIRSNKANRSPTPSRSPSPPPPPSTHPPSTSTSISDPVTRTLPPSTSTTSLKRSGSGRSPSIGIPLPPIPPAQNPRGELIFSSRVSPIFREGYEKYRFEWERRRVEAQNVAHGGGKQSWLGWVWSWVGGGLGMGMGVEKEGNGFSRGQVGQMERDRERTGSIVGGGEREPRGRRKRTLTGSSSTTSSRQVSPWRTEGGRGKVEGRGMEGGVDKGVEEGVQEGDGESERIRMVGELMREGKGKGGGGGVVVKET